MSKVETSMISVRMTNCEAQDFQIKMLRDRVDTSRMIPILEERLNCCVSAHYATMTLITSFAFQVHSCYFSHKLRS